MFASCKFEGVLRSKYSVRWFIVDYALLVAGCKLFVEIKPHNQVTHDQTASDHCSKED